MNDADMQIQLLFLYDHKYFIYIEKRYNFEKIYQRFEDSIMCSCDIKNTAE